MGLFATLAAPFGVGKKAFATRPPPKDLAMTMRTRPSGLEAVGDLPWGSHFCQFYGERMDLVDCLVPYFKAGLDNNEQCLWITSAPFGAEDATAMLRAAVPT